MGSGGWPTATPRPPRGPGSCAGGRGRRSRRLTASQGVRKLERVLILSGLVTDHHQASRGPAAAGRTSRRCRRPGAAGEPRDLPAATAPGAPGPGVSSGWREARWASTPGPSASVRVHTEYTSWPPGRTRARAASTRERCISPRRSTAAASMRHRASGRRRSTPNPEHGASTSTWSNERGRERGHGAVGHHDRQRRATPGVGGDERGPARAEVRSHHRGAGGRQREGLPARRRAQVGDPLARARAHRGGHPLRRQVLHVAVLALGDRRRGVHHGEGGEGVIGTEVGGQPLDDPVRVAEPGRLVGPGDRVVGHPAQDGVHQAARAGRAPPARSRPPQRAGPCRGGGAGTRPGAGRCAPAARRRG